MDLALGLRFISLPTLTCSEVCGYEAANSVSVQFFPASAVHDRSLVHASYARRTTFWRNAIGIQFISGASYSNSGLYAVQP